MNERITAAEFRRRAGAEPTVANGKPQIRLPRPALPNKTEALYYGILRSEFPAYDVKYEAISFRLPSGLYTPDFTVWAGNQIVLAVEVKGGWIHRDSSLSKFKEAIVRFHNIKFRFAQRRGKSQDWQIAE